jgi:DNA-directed RNA polymerase subunit L
MSSLRIPNVSVESVGKKDVDPVFLQIEGAPTTLVNGIRREIISSVPTVAMVSEPQDKSTIEIQENTSRLNNQFLSLRMSLIPVHIPVPSVETYGHSKIVTDRYQIHLDIEAKKEDIEVTTEHLKVFDKKIGTYISESDTKLVFPYEPIPIIPLKGPRGDTPGEKIKIIAGLAVGSGRDHACFSPTCCTTYQMSLDKDAINRALEKEVRDKGVKGTDRESGFRAAFEKTQALRYVDRDDNGDPKSFLFKIESIGQLNPVFIFQSGVKLLGQRMRDIKVELSTLYSSRHEETKTFKSPRVTLIADNDEYLMTFKNEDHTLGIILQDMLLRIAKDKDPENYDKWFVGYRIPHPLTPEMVMRFHRKDLKMESLFEEYLIPCLEEIMIICKTIVENVSRIYKIPRHPATKLLGEPQLSPSVSAPAPEEAEATSSAAAAAASATMSDA